MEQMQIETDEKLYLTCPWCNSDSKFSFRIVESGQMFGGGAVEVECDRCKETFPLVLTDFWRELRRRFDERTAE